VKCTLLRFWFDIRAETDYHRSQCA
jgi:hypothetical protein